MTGRRTGRYDCSSTRAAVSTHLFDRSVASEMDESRQQRAHFDCFRNSCHETSS
jgi:hypothetical protein